MTAYPIRRSAPHHSISPRPTMNAARRQQVNGPVLPMVEDKTSLWGKLWGGWK